MGGTDQTFNLLVWRDLQRVHGQEPQIALSHPLFFFSSRRRHTRCGRDWSSDVCSSDLKGLTAARRYAAIAPAAPHALHMPSHIFTRRGYWQESIDANRASVSAVSSHFDQLHALDYLTYAYLQMGQDVAAKRVVDQVGELPKLTVEHFVTGFALAAIPSRYALERGRWADAAQLALFGKEFPWGRFPQSEAQLVFARGLGAARAGDPAAARRDADRLGALREG